MLRIVRSNSHREMPWKNGGGVTTEIAVFPPGANLENFEWRVSIAMIAKDAPFSTFPGVQRRMFMLDGRGARVSIGGAPPVLMTRSSMPFEFDGEAVVHADLVDGMIAVLNVMTRRGKCRAVAERMQMIGESEFNTAAPIALLLCRDGRAQLSHPELEDALDHDDVAVLLQAEGSPQPVRMSGKATLFSIEFFPVT